MEPLDRQANSTKTVQLGAHTIVTIGQSMNLMSHHAFQVGLDDRRDRERRAPRLNIETRFQRSLHQTAVETERLLQRLLAPAAAIGEITRPPRLLEAMRYACLGGGKRFRPFLVVETASLFGAPRRQALMVAAALECVHCYSLVHDDLPAMDNDALRRGRPTAHVAFGEATAILAGDGLLTFAFDILSRPQTHPDPGVRIRLLSGLARAAGIGGMAGGQMLDLAAEGRFADETTGLDVSGIRTLQEMKTGALLQYACTSGAMLGEADRKARTALERYGTAIGEAFQIADDLLDVDGNTAMLGKATGKDAAANKATFVSLLGVEGARERLNALVARAEKEMALFGRDGEVLKAAAYFVAERRS
jgi:farnesyl diphosphate synthase